MNETLDQLDALKMNVTLGGTLDQPEWQLWSNLGPAVADALGRALDRAVEMKTDELLARSQQRIDEQLATLERRLADRQATLAPDLQRATDQIKQMVDHFTRGRGLSLDQLGRRLPAQSLFR